MKNLLTKTLVGLMLCTISSTVIAAETLTNCRVAVVDVNAVVGSSSQVQALKKEQQKKLEELQKWLTTVRADVQKQSTAEGKEKLIKKYDADFVKKQEAIKENYATKLKAIDKSISTTIVEQAKALQYDVVLTKGVVLYGGDDITQNIIKVVK